MRRHYVLPCSTQSGEVSTQVCLSPILACGECKYTSRTLLTSFIVGQLRRWQTFAIPSNPSVVRGTFRHEFSLGPQVESDRVDGALTVSQPPSYPLPIPPSPPSQSVLPPRTFTPDPGVKRPMVHPPEVHAKIHFSKTEDRTTVLPKSPTKSPQKLTKPTKLSRDERHRRRERMKQHRWVLDVEHERRFRTGMWLLMQEVLEFQEEFT